MRSPHRVALLDFLAARLHRSATTMTVAMLLTSLLSARALADVRLPSLFGDHMVFQREQANPVWGWAEPNEEVSISFADQQHSAVADADGRWRVELAPISGGGPFELHVSAANVVTCKDILVGEVWVCSGQSNMAWPVQQAKDSDLEIPSANHPQIRLLSIPQTASQEPADDFDGHWQVCSPESVAEFSAVGYFFGRRLNQALDVPIGLIDNAWGGSACEAWVPREVLAEDARYAALLSHWADLERTYDHEAALADYETRLKKWQAENAADEPQNRRRRRRPPFLKPTDPLLGQHRPANLYHGVLHPIIGFGIRGVIWYQGEANAPRAYQYRHLFPLMVSHWRDAWGQGTFPFYWVQLADFKQETPEPQESEWAELREAQTMALDQLPNSGEAVIIDLGAADDIHPNNKQDVAARLARWALVRDYGHSISYESPRYNSHQRDGNKIVIRFNGQRDSNAALRVREGMEVAGFAIAGEDRKFVWARAQLVRRNRVEVWADAVPEPVAVRYGWSDNPVCNLENRVGLPVTPFRTDDWPGVTVDVDK